MKTESLTGLLVVFLLVGILDSCKKSEYTIEDKLVTANMTFVRTNFVPFEFDPVTQQPLKANITMEGTAIFSDLGELLFVSNFKADLITGLGYDFEATYTGASQNDSFNVSATSERLQDGSIRLSEQLYNGKGKFSGIKGEGETIVMLNADGSAGTATIKWTVTY